MAAQPLPIFALPFVIFPGERIPFRIFEPRYKAMVGYYDDDSFPDSRLANKASSLHTKLIELTTDHQG